jgi:MerR family Zn(II)-responsive transcriptional regulator of zntA
MLTIGKLSQASGLSRDCLRYYEREGLLVPGGKTSAGYRLYDRDAVERLSFIRHAKRCGFTLAEISQLIGLKADGSTSCIDIRRVAEDKKNTLAEKIKDLQGMSAILGRLIDACKVNDSSLEHCPILKALEH